MGDVKSPPSTTNSYIFDLLGTQDIKETILHQINRADGERVAQYTLVHDLKNDQWAVVDDQRTQNLTPSERDHYNTVKQHYINLQHDFALAAGATTGNNASGILNGHDPEFKNLREGRTVDIVIDNSGHINYRVQSLTKDKQGNFHYNVWAGPLGKAIGGEAQAIPPHLANQATTRKIDGKDYILYIHYGIDGKAELTGVISADDGTKASDKVFGDAKKQMGNSIYDHENYSTDVQVHDPETGKLQRTIIYGTPSDEKQENSVLYASKTLEIKSRNNMGTIPASDEKFVAKQLIEEKHFDRVIINGHSYNLSNINEEVHTSTSTQLPVTRVASTAVRPPDERTRPAGQVAQPNGSPASNDDAAARDEAAQPPNNNANPDPHNDTAPPPAESQGMAPVGFAVPSNSFYMNVAIGGEEVVVYKHEHKHKPKHEHFHDDDDREHGRIRPQESAEEKRLHKQDLKEQQKLAKEQEHLRQQELKEQQKLAEEQEHLRQQELKEQQKLAEEQEHLRQQELRQQHRLNDTLKHLQQPMIHQPNLIPVPRYPVNHFTNPFPRPHK